MKDDHVKKLYEGLFLINQQSIAGDLASALGYVREILDRAKAEIVSLRKWEERRLAYAIKGQKRGTYILALFNIQPTQVSSIERDCNLSDQVLRAMIVRADHMGELEINQASQAAEKTDAEVRLRAAGDDHRDDEAGYRDENNGDDYEEVIAGEEDDVESN